MTITPIKMATGIPSLVKQASNKRLIVTITSPLVLTFTSTQVLHQQRPIRQILALSWLICGQEKLPITSWPRPLNALP